MGAMAATASNNNTTGRAISRRLLLGPTFAAPSLFGLLEAMTSVRVMPTSRWMVW
jgi:hypothetical protein